MIGNQFAPAERPLLIRGARLVGFGSGLPERLDVLIGKDGRIAETGAMIAAG